MAKWQKVRYFLRFESLDRAQAEPLRSIGNAVRSSTSIDSAEKSTVSFEFNVEKHHALISDFISNEGISDDKFGIVVSFVTERETSVVHVDQSVLNFVRLIGGYMDVSYTFV